MIRVVALLALVVGCGGGSKTTEQPATSGSASKPRSAYEELEARIPKLTAAMDQLAKDMTAVKDDCPKLAAVLRKWGGQWAIELDALWELKNKLTPDEKERYEHDHDDDAKRLKPIFDAALAKCQGDEQVEDALTVAGFRRAESAR